MATGAFRSEEVEVAIELFDDAFPPGRAFGGDRRMHGTVSDAEGGAGSTSHPPASSDYRFLGAFTPEDELVGFACYGPTPCTTGTYDLYWIAVHPAAQRTGSGTTLLFEVERRIRGHEARMLVVETSSRSDYAATREFYRASGYDGAARMRDFYAPSDDRIILTKRFQTSQAGREGVTSR